MAAVSVVAAGGAAAAAEAGQARSAVAAPVPDVLDDLTELTLAQTAAAIRQRRISSEEAVGAHLERIERFEGTYMAFNAVLAENALARARELDRRPPVGVLHGVPIVVKDNYWTKGVETTANSHIFAGFVPDEDATCVTRLLDAGAVILGKTQMGPLATTRATTPDGVVTTVNAWTPSTPSHDPGGSSSGSATAVAGRLACSSIGTQTGGSITSPSNQQGLTGLKPTMGRTSLYGIIPLTYSRDHPGPLARDALDAAIMTEVMAGPDARDPRTLGLPPVPDLVHAAEPAGSPDRPRVRWPTTLGVPPGYTSGSSATALARTAMLGAFADLGVRVREIALPEEWELLTGGAFNNVRLPERTEPFLPYLKQDLKLFGVSLNTLDAGPVPVRRRMGKGAARQARATHARARRAVRPMRCGAADEPGPVRHHRPAGDRVPDRVPAKCGERPRGPDRRDRRRPAVRRGPPARARRRVPGGDRLAPAAARRIRARLRRRARPPNVRG